MSKRKEYVINHLDSDYVLHRVAGVDEGVVLWCFIAQHDDDPATDERDQEMRFPSLEAAEKWMRDHGLDVTSYVFPVSVWA